MNTHIETALIAGDCIAAQNRQCDSVDGKSINDQAAHNAVAACKYQATDAVCICSVDLNLQSARRRAARSRLGRAVNDYRLGDYGQK